MPYDRDTPYNDLPPVPPQGVALETHAVLKQVIAATRALAELKGVGSLIPNQSVLVRLIGLQEARLSSEIENIVTTNDELYRAFADDTLKTDPQTKEVLSYNDALWHGFQCISEGRPLTTRLYEEIVRIITRHDVGVRRITGTHIAGTGGRVVYTPPEGESLLRQKLADLERFLYAADGLDPLVRLAVFHYQFEAIHPFPDGNGRTGRLLNILALVEAGLLDVPILYLSGAIIADKPTYYDLLRRVTEEGAWEEWTLFLLRAVEQTALDTRRRILDIRALMQQTQDTVRERLPRLYSKDLIEVLFAQPYCKIRFLEQAGIAKRDTASKYLQELSRLGVLSPRREIGREAYYVNDAFLSLLSQ